MGGRVEVRNLDVVLGNIQNMSEKLRDQASESADYASVVLFDKAKENAGMTDHSLEELAQWNVQLMTDGVRRRKCYVGAYSQQMAEDSGPHPDEDVHIQSGKLYENIERKVIIDGDHVIAVAGVDEGKVPYIGYLINGTSYMRPRDFLGHALEDVKESMKKILVAGIAPGQTSRGGNVE